MLFQNLFYWHNRFHTLFEFICIILFRLLLSHEHFLTKLSAFPLTKCEQVVWVFITRHRLLLCLALVKVMSRVASFFAAIVNVQYPSLRRSEPWQRTMVRFHKNCCIDWLLHILLLMLSTFLEYGWRLSVAVFQPYCLFYRIIKIFSLLQLQELAWTPVLLQSEDVPSVLHQT